VLLVLPFEAVHERLQRLLAQITHTDEKEPTGVAVVPTRCPVGHGLGLSGFDEFATVRTVTLPAAAVFPVIDRWLPGATSRTMSINHTYC
jgi:hypothetical protein